MTVEEIKDFYQKNTEHHGIASQIIKTAEECGELLQVLSKWHFGELKWNQDIITELADVSVMCDQLAVFFGYGAYESEKERKIRRQMKRLNRKIKTTNDDEK